jgi:hypothetical protein
MRFLAVLLALTLPAFAQIRYSPTGFTAPFISTVTNQASAQAYLGISGGGGGSITNYGGSATNLSVYSSGTTNWPLRVAGTNTTRTAYIDKDGYLNLLRGDGHVSYGFFGANTLGGGGRGMMIGANSGGGPGADFWIYGDGGVGIQAINYQTMCFLASATFKLRNDTLFGWSSGSPESTSLDTALYRNAAGIIEVNNGTAGTYRDLLLRTLYGKGGTVTASQPVLDISQTWNNAGVNFTAAKVNVTNTASGSASKLADFQVDGTPIAYIDKNGRIVANKFQVGPGSFSIISGYPQINDDASGEGYNTRLGLYCSSGFQVNWGSQPNGYSGLDTALGRASAGVVSVTSGTAGQYRDLVTRSTFATNASITNITADSYVTTQQTLSYASATNLTVDANKSLHFVSLTNTAYFAQPSNLGVGRTFTVILQQDGTGTRAVTFNTNYWKFPGGVVPTITTNANAYDVLSCISCPYGTNVFAIHNAKFQ